MADNEISLARKKAAELYKPMNTRIKEGPGLAGGWEANGPVGHVVDSLAPTNFNANATQMASALPPLPGTMPKGPNPEASLRDPTPIWSTAPPKPTTATATLLPDTPATAVEKRNADAGFSVESQRNAIPAAEGGLRYANNIQGRRPNETPTFNLGTYDGNATIYGRASTPGGKVNEFVGTGVGSSGYENTEQYKQGVARAAADKAQLAQIEEGKKEQELVSNLRNAAPGGHKVAAKVLDNYYRQQEVDKEIGLRDAVSRRSTQMAMNTAMRDQANKDRQYNFDVSKTGFEQDKALAERRDKSFAAFAEQLGTRFIGEDGKPDAGRVSDAMSKVQEELAARTNALVAVPKDHPQYAEAQKLAKELSSRGLDALDASAREKLMLTLEMRDTMRKQHSVMPWGSTFVDGTLSDLEITGVEENMIGSPTLRTKNKGGIRAADLAYTEPANRIAPDWFKQRSTRFEPLVPENLRRK